MELDLSGRKVKLLAYQENIVNKIASIADYVYRNDVELKFSGFLLHGPPGNGKTEIAKQAAYRINGATPSRIFLIDGSDIASPRWGDAEEKLKKAFLDEENKNRRRKIIIFDDIESTLMGRDIEIAKEWHFSINSVAFHLLDEIDPSETLVIATTNKPEMVDPALESRLYSIAIDKLTKKQLLEFLEKSIRNAKFGTDKTHVESSVRSKIESGLIETLRDVEHEILIEVIEEIGE